MAFTWVFFPSAGRGGKYRRDVVRLREEMSEADENLGFLLESSAFQRPSHWVYFFLALLLFPTLLLFFGTIIEDEWGLFSAIFWLSMIHLSSIVLSALFLRVEIMYGLLASIILFAISVFFLVRLM